MFCGPETAPLFPRRSRGQQRAVEGQQNTLLPEVSVNKCFIVISSVKVNKHDENIYTNSLKDLEYARIKSLNVFQARC